MNNLQVKHNYKLTLEDKKLILLEYTLNRTNENISSICDKFGISKRTLYDVIHSFDKASTDLIVNESIKEYKRNFTKKANNIIEKALNKIDNQLNDEDEKINISQLSTMLGILYDKTRLEDNLSTSNNSFNININIDK